VVSPEELARLGTTAPTTEQAIQFRRRALVTLAWHMQEEHLAEIAAEAAVGTLARFYCDEARTNQAAAEGWADGFLGVAHERSGLFIAVDEGLHTFAHQAFREYLAATHLVNAGEKHLIEEVLRRAPTPDEWWEQVLLLAGAHPELSSGAAGRLVEELLERKSLDYAYLAARCAQDMTDKLPGAGRKRLQDWLMAVVGSDARPVKERVQAGDALALAGDPRPGVGLRPDGLPDIAWRQVPAGRFTMGSRDDSLAISETKETPQRQVHLPVFLIARYPVTNTQYAAFVRDGGYTEKWRTCWTRAGWSWKGDRSRPEAFGGVFDLPNHPVVGVTWYEAVAFCNWLTERLRQAGELGADEVVTLPGEPQWEKAARGTDGRVYPWGNKPDPERANYSDAGVGATSAAGCFPGGAGPYGVLDMSGNVWEWCRTKWQESYRNYGGDDLAGAANDLEGDAPRVLRGGAFYDDRRSVRCAVRDRDLPDYVLNCVGFRLVVAPGFL